MLSVMPNIILICLVSENKMALLFEYYMVAEVIMSESPTNRTKIILSLSSKAITPIVTILEYKSKFY